MPEISEFTSGYDQDNKIIPKSTAKHDVGALEAASGLMFLLVYLFQIRQVMLWQQGDGQRDSYLLIVTLLLVGAKRTFDPQRKTSHINLGISSAPHFIVGRLATRDFGFF